MARPRIEAIPPHWFDAARYSSASELDAADWYLNLALRTAITRGYSRLGRQYVRGAKPVIRRADQYSRELDLICNELKGDFTRILNKKEPRLSVEYLTAEELYLFEQRLPEKIRSFGRTYVRLKTPARDAPAGFTGPIDQLLWPRMLQVSVRINIARPDKVLLADLQAFLDRERRAFAKIDLPQPYAAALRKLGKCNRANFRTFAKQRLLPFLDLEQWRIDSGVRYSRRSLRKTSRRRARGSPRGAQKSRATAR